MALSGWTRLWMVAAVAGCSPQQEWVDADRAAFDLVIANANGGGLGLAVLSGYEDAVYDCYKVEAPSSELSLEMLTDAIQRFYEVATTGAIPEQEERQELAGRLLVAVYSIQDCQDRLKPVPTGKKSPPKSL